MLLQRLQALLGDQAVLSGERIPEKARSDSSRTGRHLPAIYIRPRNVEDISKVLRLCNAERLPVVVQGGMTGLAGAANPQADTVVIAMDLLCGIEEIDTARSTSASLPS